MVNDIFVGLLQIAVIIATPFVIISAWVAINEEDEETLGCPDPELHDRNNENFGVLVTALDLEKRIQDPLWCPHGIHRFGIKEYVKPESVGG